MKKTSFLIFISAAAIYGCSKSVDTISTTTTDCSTVSTTFSTDVLPAFNTYCSYSTGCHASGSSKGPGALTMYAQIYANRVSIRSSVSSGTMPENATLSSSVKNKILCWIDNGASDN